MERAISLFLGFLGGLIAWAVTEFLAKPIKRFIQLRDDAAHALAQYEDKAWQFEDPAEQPDEEWLQKRKANYEAVGSALVGFAYSQRFVTRILAYKAPGRSRYYVSSAGRSLIVLGEVKPATTASKQSLSAVKSGLKLWP